MLKILNGDCLAILPTLGPCSIDCIVTDPPYGQTSLAWDAPVDGWLAAAEQCLKPNASVWIFGSLRSLAPTVAACDDGNFGGWKFAQDIVWEKHNGSSFHADRFRRVHEQAVQLYRGKWADVYRDVQTTPDAVAKAVRRKERPAHMGAIANSTFVSEDGGPRMMRSVIAIRSMHGSAIHPTQKPEGIVEPLLRYSCPPGGTVLDPFVGSGTTAVVAKANARSCIGIEIDAEMAKMAMARVSA